MPARKFIENLPATKNLPPSKDRSTKTPAFRSVAAPVGPAWTALGPFPIPNGQTENRTDPVSGRVTAIVVHPTNASIAYVGTAQGGLYRTVNGGTTWVQLMDNASAGVAGTPLAIGALAIDPTNPANLVVGTGEGNLSGDSYFGSGLYIITAADGVSPVVNGPYNLRASDSADIFTGRSIVSIAIDPANHNNIFCATSSGVGGIIPSAYSILPNRALYRSSNAFAGVDVTGTPGFTALTVEATETNAIMTSVVVDPSNGNNLVCALFSQSASDKGGVYLSTNALSAVPTFTHQLIFDDLTNTKLAINKVGGVVTVYAATSEDFGSGEGHLYKSITGGATFGETFAADGFAGTQGFYDIAVAVDPTNADKVYLGGNINQGIFLYSTDGGGTFNSSITGLHADVHTIAVAPSNPAVIYHGNDGGIWKSTNSGLAWTSLNNSTFSATQFSGLAVHPLDRNFSLGGTQDNGTELLKTDTTFIRADFGDGGYSLIDQSATSTIDLAMYHTYFNAQNSLIGTARVLSVPCATEGEWSFRGIYGGSVNTTAHCDGTSDRFNGISISDDVNFYAPQALGPGIPNTWYFGTDKLYRSSDRADTAVVVSQTLETDSNPISAIAISPQDDNVRIVGLNNGKVFATTSGVSTLSQVAGVGATSGSVATPATGVGRIAIDPNNKAVAYICFNGFGTPGSPLVHVWKTTNLNVLKLPCGVVDLLPASTGLPDIPVNAIAIDPVTLAGGQSTDIYVGTDAGVYYSHDGGTSWSVYGSGFPHVAVYGLEIQNPSRVVRAATHGRGLYETATVSQITPTPTPVPTPSSSPPYGEVISPSTCAPLASSSVTFSWSTGNASAYWLTIGDEKVAEPGGSNIYSSGQTAGTSALVTHLPTDGRKIYVRLWSNIGGTWFNPPQDYIYNAAAVNVVPPAIAPSTGTYKKKVTVNMATTTPGATIRYTLDGTIPTSVSPLFVHPFSLTKTTTVRAKAFKTGVPDSPPSAAGYTITKK